MAFAHLLTSNPIQALKQRPGLGFLKTMYTLKKAFIISIFYINFAGYLALLFIIAAVAMAFSVLAGAYVFIFILFLSFALSHIDGFFAFFGGIFVACTWQLWVTNIITLMEKAKRAVYALRTYPFHEVFYGYAMYPSLWITLKLNGKNTRKAL